MRTIFPCQHGNIRRANRTGMTYFPDSDILTAVSANDPSESPHVHGLKWNEDSCWSAISTSTPLLIIQCISYLFNPCQAFSALPFPCVAIKVVNCACCLSWGVVIERAPRERKSSQSSFTHLKLTSALWSSGSRFNDEKLSPSRGHTASELLLLDGFRPSQFRQWLFSWQFNIYWHIEHIIYRCYQFQINLGYKSDHLPTSHQEFGQWAFEIHIHHFSTSTCSVATVNTWWLVSCTIY